MQSVHLTDHRVVVDRLVGHFVGKLLIKYALFGSFHVYPSLGSRRFSLASSLSLFISKLDLRELMLFVELAVHDYLDWCLCRLSNRGVFGATSAEVAQNSLLLLRKEISLTTIELKLLILVL